MTAGRVLEPRGQSPVGAADREVKPGQDRRGVGAARQRSGARPPRLGTGGAHARIPPMPELPDVVLYIEALERRILDQPLAGVRLASPFLLRTAQPPLGALTGKHVRRLRRLGKRIALGFEDDLWLVLHLMINGRLHWKQPECQARRPLCAGRVRFSERHADAHRVRPEEAGGAPPGPGRGGALRA